MKITMWILGAAMMLSGCATIEQSFIIDIY